MDKYRRRKIRRTTGHGNSRKPALRVCVAYSHADAVLLNQLLTWLIPLQRLGLFSLWVDLKIPPGNEWQAEIHTNFARADLILVLVSPKFLGSDYAYNFEMQRALQRHRAGEARVIPIILRHSMWQRTPLAKLEALPRVGRPVMSFADRDRAWADVAEGIGQVAEELIRLRRSRKQQAHAA